MNNRLHNATNVYQGKAKRELCICSAGLLRSPTAANVFHREFGFNTRAAGLEPNFALIPVDEVLLYWADEIVCMEAYQKEALEKRTDTPIINLGIRDSFGYMDEALQTTIKERYLSGKKKTAKQQLS